MKLYFKYVSMLLKCQMQYKASFVMTATGQFLVSLHCFSIIRSCTSPGNQTM
jgi:ABC-2 type transport system permease protein